MMDEGDMLVGQRGDRPVFAKAVQGVIGVEASLEIQGQVQAQQRPGGHRAVVIALFLRGHARSQTR